MPRYFFHIEDEHLEHDHQGTELEDAASARVEATRFAGALLKERSKSLWEGSSWRLLVTDERSMIVFTVLVSTINGSGAAARYDGALAINTEL